MNNIKTHISELKKQIAEFPSASIATKTVHGNQYYYHRQTLNRKRVEKYTPLDEAEEFRQKIKKRKELTTEPKKLFQQAFPHSSKQILYYTNFQNKFILIENVNVIRNQKIIF